MKNHLCERKKIILFACLSITAKLAKDLPQYCADNLALPQTKAFSGMWKDAVAAMLKEDLKLAEIKYENDEGVADFHSLRHTFGTLAARSGVTPQVLQKMMRHSDINLTLKYYVHLRLSDKAEAISKLPPIKITKKKQFKNRHC